MDLNAQVILQLVANYGLGIVLAVFLAIAFWRILIFVLKENSKREDRLAAIIELHLKELSEKTTRTNELIIMHDRNEMDWVKSMKDADMFQRQEHKDISEILRGIKLELDRTRG